MIAMVLCLAGTPALSAATLATEGEPQMTIVLAEGAIPSERTAAEELAGTSRPSNRLTGRTKPSAYRTRRRIPASPTGWSFPTRR